MIKQPSTYLLISIMCTVGTTVIVGVLLLTTNAFEQEGWFAGITVFALMYLLYIGLILFSLNWKLELHDSYCTHTNLFGKKRKYLYQDLKVVDVSSGFRVYYNNRRVFDISIFQDNWKAFPNEYKKHNKIIMK